MSNNGVSSNGHNKGATGEVAPTARWGRRSALRVLEKTIRRTDVIAREQIADIVRFATNVRNDPDCTHRDKLRACEVITALVNKGIDVAMYQDKNDRLASGDDTERSAIRVEFVHVDRITR